MTLTDEPQANRALVLIRLSHSLRYNILGSIVRTSANDGAAFYITGLSEPKVWLSYLVGTYVQVLCSLWLLLRLVLSSHQI